MLSFLRRSSPVKYTIIDNMEAKEILRDSELLGDKASVTHEDAMHFGELTPEELVMEKKLVRKIDFLIMPLVVLVYLMNYIDRYVPLAKMPIAILTGCLQQQLRSS